MSLPSGLLFYLDYTYGNSNGPHSAGESIYGQPSGKGIQSGSLAVGGQYDLAGAGFSRQHVEVTTLAGAADFEIIEASFDPTDAAHQKLVQFDSDALELTSGYRLLAVKLEKLTDLDRTMTKDIILKAAGGHTAAVGESLGSAVAHNVRKVNQLGTTNGSGTFTPDVFGGTHVLMLVKDSGSAMANAADIDASTVSYVLADTFSASATGGDTLVTPAFESADLNGDDTRPIPEIDIKIESIPVTAQTRKLRARWSPELAQDLNAYHSMDAEVELTQILSEQIALEIDREILNDLLTGAQGANFFWSRSPGKFVNKRTGAAVERASTLQPGPAFTGTVREWYETLTETIIDVANEIHRKTLRGSANFIVVGPDVATILEASVLYRPSYSLDGDGQVGAPFTMGAEKVGTLSNRFTVYKDPYFPRNKVLVGYKGGSYLETGFVYAPYVPLIVTPTIFQPDDFTPRKGVMTRYGKKMVRADFFGTVTCLDMNII